MCLLVRFEDKQKSCAKVRILLNPQSLTATYRAAMLCEFTLKNYYPDQDWSSL